MDLLYAIFIVLGFLAVVMFLEGLYLTWSAYLGPEAKRIEHRLQALSAADVSLTSAPIVRKRLLSEMPALERVLLQLPRIHVLDRFLLQTGLNLAVADYLGTTLVLFLVGSSVGLLLDLPGLLCLAAGLAPAVIWFVYLERCRLHRLKQVELQLPDALDLMARAMQAGHAFSSALRLVGTEGPKPIAQEFQTVFDEVNFGIAFDKALGHLAFRVASRDLRFFVIATVIQRETGGNLAEILGSIAAMIRERQRLAGSIRVLSAEGRISAWILSVLPFAVAGVISMVNREFISALWIDPIGRRVSGVALVLMVAGILWMWRLVKIRV